MNWYKQASGWEEVDYSHPAHGSKTIRFMTNPSPGQIKQIVDVSRWNDARAILDLDTGDLYVWPAEQAVHAVFQRAMGLTNIEEFYGDAISIRKDVNEYYMIHPEGYREEHSNIEQITEPSEHEEDIYWKSKLV